MKKDLFYALTCLCFTIVIGGAVYEHLAVVPKWSAAPPLSLSMFQGQYGLKPEVFWKLIHPVNLVLFLLALALHWKTARKNTLAGVFVLYIAILAITRVYFVPELLSIITTPFSETVDPALTNRSAWWEALSLVRLGVLLVMAVFLFLGLAKPAVQGQQAKDQADNRAPGKTQPALAQIS